MSCAAQSGKSQQPGRENCGPGCHCFVCDGATFELFEALEQIESVLRSTGFRLVIGSSTRDGFLFAGCAPPSGPVRIACHGDCLADCFAELAAILTLDPKLAQSNPALTT